MPVRPIIVAMYINSYIEIIILITVGIHLAEIIGASSYLYASSDQHRSCGAKTCVVAACEKLSNDRTGCMAVKHGCN